MTPVLIGILCMAGFIALMFLGVPVPFSMLVPAVIGLSVMKTPKAAVQMLSGDFIAYFSNYTLTVGPLFGLMGFFASYSGLGSKLFSTLNAYIGHRKGGLASATVVACTAFGAICGSVPATISTMSAVAYPEMRKAGYSAQLSGACIAAAPTIAILIPPSSNFIIYGMATNTSIGALFMGGIGPGILLTIADILAVKYIAWRHPDWAPSTGKSTWKQRWTATRDGGLIEIFLVFIIAMGGMFAGFFTTTEASAIGAVGMLVILLLRGKMDWKKFWRAAEAGARLMAMVFNLLACAAVFGKMFTVSTIPAKLGAFVASLSVPGWAVVGVIIVIYFILGMFADLLSMMLVTLPAFYPIVCTQLGFSPVWFGIVLTILIGIGGITPPVGNGVFMTRGCVSWDPDASVKTIFGGVWPFVVVSLICAVILIFVPQISTFIPDLLLK